MSTSATDVKNGARAKAGYYLADGTRVPSVTTILGIVAKPALIKWANNLGLQGIDSTKYVDALAKVGSLAHAMILADLRGDRPADAADGYDAATVDLAENCLISFYNWKKDKTIVPILLETPLVSEIHHFGGTADFFGLVNGHSTIIDFKTGKGIWPEHFIQLAAYRWLIMEAADKYAAEYGLIDISEYTILNIPRAETEAFDAKTRTDLSDQWQYFLHARAMYELGKKIDKV